MPIHIDKNGEAILNNNFNVFKFLIEDLDLVC